MSTIRRQANILPFVPSLDCPLINMNTYNSFNELAAGQASGLVSDMSTFNSQVSDELTKKIDPLFPAVEQAGEKFKAKKDEFLAEFEKRGISPAEFKQMYATLRELKDKRRTLKSVAELYPNIPKKEIQAMTAVLARDEKPLLDLSSVYWKGYYALSQELDKQFDILNRVAPDDADLKKVYDAFDKRCAVLDDTVRAGLK